MISYFGINNQGVSSLLEREEMYSVVTGDVSRAHGRSTRKRSRSGTSKAERGKQASSVSASATLLALPRYCCTSPFTVPATSRPFSLRKREERLENHVFIIAACVETRKCSTWHVLLFIHQYGGASDGRKCRTLDTEKSSPEQIGPRVYSLAKHRFRISAKLFFDGGLLVYRRRARGVAKTQVRVNQVVLAFRARRIHALGLSPRPFYFRGGAFIPSDGMHEML